LKTDGKKSNVHRKKKTPPGRGGTRFKRLQNRTKDRLGRKAGTGPRGRKVQELKRKGRRVPRRNLLLERKGTDRGIKRKGRTAKTTDYSRPKGQIGGEGWGSIREQPK